VLVNELTSPAGCGEKYAFSKTPRTAVNNVIKFKPRPKQKPPVKRPVWLRKALTIAGVVLFFVLVWAYYAFIATPGAPGL